MRLVVAPDKFRGSAEADDVVDAVTRAAGARGWSTVGLPMADGGEGTLAALGGANRTLTVTGPLGDTVEASWRLSGETAVIEMAEASGLALVPEGENDPLAASTYGTGELIAFAVERGARRIVVGVGGSATTDGGLGALRAMHPLQRYRAIDIIVACDVETKFSDAARIFGPQKGATAAQIGLLTGRLDRLAQVYETEHGVDVSELPRAGAAGGLAGGLAAIGAQLLGGFEVVADEVGLADALLEADLVVTGEGKLDDQSFEGKVVGGVAALAAEVGVPVLAIAGQVELSHSPPAGLTVVSLTERFGAEASMNRTTECIESVIAAGWS